MEFDIDLNDPIEDWFSNIKIAHNPNSILFKKEDFKPEWIRLFQVPYVDQTISNSTEANPIWLKLKENYISGSEIASAIDESPFDNSNREEYILIKSGRKKKVFNNEQIKAMSHGKINERIAGLRYTYEINDITFNFGIIPHKDKQWSFLGVSPDLIAFRKNRAAEIKSPYKRSIFYQLKVDDVMFSGYKLNENVQVLIREVLISGDKHRYLTITNLPASISGLLNKMIYYWHQCQLQWEVLDIGNCVDFVQFGTFPNPFYVNNDLLTITEVPCNKSWITTYGDKLRKTWDEIEYWRRKDIILPESKKRKIDIDSSPNECPFE